MKTTAIQEEEEEEEKLTKKIRCLTWAFGDQLSCSNWMCK